MNLDSKHLNWGALSAVLAMTAIAGYHYFAPMPDAGPAPTKKTSRQLEAEVDRAEQKLADSEKIVKELTWQVSLDEVGPQAMAWVSSHARQNYVEVKAFRPQRTEDAEGLIQLNYMVTAEGSFMNVMKLIDVFEREDSLLAVKGVQLASLDGITDTVRATISLVAYRRSSGG